MGLPVLLVRGEQVAADRVRRSLTVSPRAAPHPLAQVGVPVESGSSHSVRGLSGN